MTWYWYARRANELMLDLDARTGTGDGRARLAQTRVRLRAAIDAGLLDVAQLYLYRSANPDHLHLVVRLTGAPAVDDELIDTWLSTWEMQLYSDPYRARCNIMRSILGVGAPALLISPEPWRGFDRDPDARCDCNAKHDFEGMKDCLAAAQLRGTWSLRDSYFGKLAGGYTVPELRCQEGPVNLAEFTRLVPREEK